MCLELDLIKQTSFKLSNISNSDTFLNRVYYMYF